MNSEQRDLLHILGYFYLQHGKADKAETIFAALSALAPRDTRFAQGLACAQIRSGKAEPALEILDRLLDQGEIGAMVHLLRGQALAQLNRTSEASRAMQAYMSARAIEA